MNGRLGGVKVLVMENRDRKTAEDPSHHLFFAEAPDRRQGAQERGDAQRGRNCPWPARGRHSPAGAASGGMPAGTTTRRSWRGDCGSSR